MKRLHQKTRGEVGRNAVREAPAEHNSDATIIERAPAGLARPRSDDLADPRQAGPSWDPAPLPAPGMRVHEVRREHHYEYEYVYEDEKAPAEAPLEQQFVPPSHQLAAQSPEPRGLPPASPEPDTSHWRADAEPQNMMRSGVLAEVPAPEPPTVIWRPDSQHSQKSQRSQRSQRSGRPDSLSTMSRLGETNPFRKRLGKYLVPLALGGVGLVVFGVSVAIFSAVRTPAATHAEARVETPAAQAPEPVRATPPPVAPPPASPPPPVAAAEGAAAAALPAAASVPHHAHKARRKGANVGQASAQGEKGGSSESSASAGEAATAQPAAKSSATETKTPETKPARPVEDQAAQELGSSLQ